MNFLGYDSVSAFHGRGKVTVWKIANKSEEYAATFGDMGATITPPAELQTRLCRFVCHLYGFEDCDEVNDVRYQLFKRGKCDEEQTSANAMDAKMLYAIQMKLKTLTTTIPRALPLAVMIVKMNGTDTVIVHSFLCHLSHLVIT